ncbi:MAG: type IX secretion system membrane protein PorP/SprF [Bacteroidota bacterium]
MKTTPLLCSLLLLCWLCTDCYAQLWPDLSELRQQQGLINDAAPPFDNMLDVENSQITLRANYRQQHFAASNAEWIKWIPQSAFLQFNQLIGIGEKENTRLLWGTTFLEHNTAPLQSTSLKSRLAVLRKLGSRTWASVGLSGHLQNHRIQMDQLILNHGIDPLIESLYAADPNHWLMDMGAGFFFQHRFKSQIRLFKKGKLSSDHWGDTVYGGFSIPGVQNFLQQKDIPHALLNYRRQSRQCYLMCGWISTIDKDDFLDLSLRYRISQAPYDDQWHIGLRRYFGVFGWHKAHQPGFWIGGGLNGLRSEEGTEGLYPHLDGGVSWKNCRLGMGGQFFWFQNFQQVLPAFEFNFSLHFNG